MLLILIVLALLAGLYLFCLWPRHGRREEMRPFMENYIAHRGLYDNAAGIPENSLPAFRRAVEAGYGVELDVQLTADDRLVVFHDETLSRICGDPRKLHELTYDELMELRLLDTEERIPLLRDVLDTVNGAGPMVVEIKSEGRYIETTRRTHDMLRNYRGVYCVESFHPMVLRWYRKHSPETVRGQLSTHYRKDGEDLPRWQGFLLTNLLLNCLSRPDFIAYNCKYRTQPSFVLCTKLLRPVSVAWTVRSAAELTAIRPDFQVFIFDSFLPDGAPSPSLDKKHTGEEPT